MDNIIRDISKLHTTELGEKRIEKNLDLHGQDVLKWCKEAVMKADLFIKSGKNIYVYYNGVVITIHGKSYTIITAHKIKGRVRPMEESDYACLKEFLYQAIFIPKGRQEPSRDILNNHELSIYISGFGCQNGDIGVVLEQNNQVIGAAWTRIISAHGHIDNKTPELAISLLPEFRGYGMGTKMMKELFKALKSKGYTQTSLSVQKDNPAVRLYKRLGYEIINNEENPVAREDYLMVKEL